MYVRRTGLFEVVRVTLEPVDLPLLHDHAVSIDPRRSPLARSPLSLDFRMTSHDLRLRAAGSSWARLAPTDE